MIQNAIFKSLLTKCFKDGKVPNKILIALSGGVDSVCLTYLLSKYRDLYDTSLQIHAVTIDHRYRDGSADEARSVGDLVSKWGVQHNVIPLDYKNRSVHLITNFEEVARTMRYEAFRNLGQDLLVSHLFVAHNYNDQLETCMQRIRLQSTVFGLKGLKYRSLIPIPPKAPYAYETPIRIIRPLLDFSKKDIIATCTENSIDWFEDYTNKDIHLTDRNLFRYFLNEYIPEKLKEDPDSDLKLISEEKISDTLSKTDQLVTSIQAQVRRLGKQLVHENKLRIFYNSGVMKLELSRDLFRDNSELVIARLLFETLYPISATTNYFWTFSKVLNSLVPRLMAVVESNDLQPRKMTYLNLLFQIKPTEKGLNIRLSRQPIAKHEISRVSQQVPVSVKGPSDWVLFDGRFWLRFRTAVDMVLTIVPYFPSIHDPLLEAQFKSTKLPTYKSYYVPMVISNRGTVSLPTMGLIDPYLQIEWRLQDNPFTSSAIQT